MLVYTTRLDTQEEALRENHASFTLSEDQVLRRSYGQNSLVPTVGKESNLDDGRAAIAFFSGGSVLRHYGRVDKAKIICKLELKFRCCFEQQLHDVSRCCKLEFAPTVTLGDCYQCVKSLKSDDC